jgi:hypothetical protein
MKKERELFTSLIYIAITMLYDSKVKYGKARKYIYQIFTGELEEVKSSTFKHKDDFLSVVKNIDNLGISLTDEEKEVILNSLVKEVYSAVYNLKAYSNNDNALVKRQEYKTEYILKDALAKSVIMYLQDKELGEKYKKAYLHFKKDISQFTEHNYLIAELVSSNDYDAEVIGEIIESRKKELENIMSKYKNIFNVTKESLISVWEEEKIVA